MSLNYASNRKQQPIRIATAGWFINLHPKIDINRMIKFMKNNVKVLIKKDPEFALVCRPIFNGQKSEKTKYSFIKKEERSKAIHIEVVQSQALEVTSAIHRIIKSPSFKQIYHSNLLISMV